MAIESGNNHAKDIKVDRPPRGESLSAEYHRCGIGGLQQSGEVYRMGPSGRSAYETGCIRPVDPNDKPEWSLIDWLFDKDQSLTYGQIEALREAGKPIPKRRSS